MISSVLYGTKWYKWPKEIKNMCLFMMMRSQKPITFLIVGIIDLSLETFLQVIFFSKISIIKTAYFCEIYVIPFYFSYCSIVTLCSLSFMIVFNISNCNSCERRQLKFICKKKAKALLH